MKLPNLFRGKSQTGQPPPPPPAPPPAPAARRVYAEREDSPPTRRNLERVRRLRNRILKLIGGDWRRWSDPPLPEIAAAIARRMAYSIPPGGQPSWVIAPAMLASAVRQRDGIEADIAAGESWGGAAEAVYKTAVENVKACQLFEELADRERVMWGFSLDQEKYLGALKAHHRARKAQRDIVRGRHGPVALAMVESPTVGMPPTPIPLLRDNPALPDAERQRRAELRELIDVHVRRRQALLRGEA